MAMAAPVEHEQVKADWHSKAGESERKRAANSRVQRELIWLLFSKRTVREPAHLAPSSLIDTSRVERLTID